MTALPRRSRSRIRSGPPLSTAPPPRCGSRATTPRAADQQLAALDQHAARLERNVGSLQAVSEERSGLERGLAQLGDEGRALRDALAEQHVARPPAWARELFGARPAHPRHAEQYDRGVREVARYRIEHDVVDDAACRGPEPDDRHARGAWRQATRTMHQVQRRLGLEVERHLSRDRGAGRDL
jgi:hypothetical protein